LWVIAQYPMGRYKEENEGLLQAGRGFLTP